MCPMVVLDVIRLWLKCDAHTQEVRLSALLHLELVNATIPVCSLVAERHFVFENRSKSSVSAELVNLLRSILSSLLDPSSTSVRRVSHYTNIFGSNPAATLGNMDLFLDSLARILGNTVYCAFTGEAGRNLNICSDDQTLTSP